MLYSVTTMTCVFDFKEYREFLRALTKERGARGQTQVELAKSMDCQAAYFSQVLKDKADLSEDQSLKLCRYLQFSDLETEYFLLILRLSKAATKSLSDYLEQKRRALSDVHQEVEGRILSQKNQSLNELNVYYCSSPIPSLIHLATSCKELQISSAISQRFSIEKSIVDEHLQKLEKFGLVKFENGCWNYSGGSIHFPKSSPLDHSFQLSRRLLALESLALRRPEDLGYSVTFASDEKTIKKIRAFLLKTIEEIHKVAEPSSSQDVFSICIDLFRN